MRIVKFIVYYLAGDGFTEALFNSSIKKIKLSYRCFNNYRLI